MHREQLLRCLLHGIARLDEGVADDIRTASHSFDLVSWTYAFYGEHRDIRTDLADIEALLQHSVASPDDIAEASSFKRRLALAIYRVGDMLPFLIPRLANEQLELHLRDLWRYNHNKNDIAEQVRRALKVQIEAATSAGRPILLLAHSMGSVIAFDALWQLSRLEERVVNIDLWLTMGSPLGQRYIQKRLLGSRETGSRRYPDNVRRWCNVSAVGDMTSVDRRLRNDFKDMLMQGLVESIADYPIYSPYRSAGNLNVHSEYGYLANETTARLVRDWWLEASANPTSVSGA